MASVWEELKRRNVVRVAIAYVIGPLMIFPEYLFALAMLYTVGGLGVGLLLSPEEQDELDDGDDEPQEQLA